MVTILCRGGGGGGGGGELNETDGDILFASRFFVP